MGGERAIRAIQSTYASGIVKRRLDGSEGKFALRSAKPNLLNIEYDIGGFEAELGYNGRSIWTRVSRDGLQTLTGDLSNHLQAIAAFRSSLWLD
ncbi:MAG: hypothetical protein ACRD6X_05620 [Pyrinomonadaceae bacterium]